jgi:hypothetical protein
MLTRTRASNCSHGVHESCRETYVRCSRTAGTCTRRPAVRSANRTCMYDGVRVPRMLSHLEWSVPEHPVTCEEDSGVIHAACARLEAGVDYVGDSGTAAMYRWGWLTSRVDVRHRSRAGSLYMRRRSGCDPLAVCALGGRVVDSGSTYGNDARSTGAAGGHVRQKQCARRRCLPTSTPQNC